MKQFVSLRLPRKLLAAIEDIHASPKKSRSLILIETLKNGYLFKRNGCRKILVDIQDRGTVKQQLTQSYHRGVWASISIESSGFSGVSIIGERVI